MATRVEAEALGPAINQISEMDELREFINSDSDQRMTVNEMLLV